MNKAAVIQMTSSMDVTSNLKQVEQLLAQAANLSAKLVVLPENFAYMGAHEGDKLSIAEVMGGGPIQDFLAQQALKYGIWIVAGTIPIQTSNANKVHSACLVFNEQGTAVARYDKIHLFDVTVEDKQGYYLESHSIEAGLQTVIIDTPVGRLGLAICYDVRFPELFRILLSQGAELFALPAAFTAVTGQAHWEILIRARAIENLSFMLAAGQSGLHANGRETYGHSMIVDPWGQVLQCLPQNPGVIIAEINREQQQLIRKRFPVIAHRKL
ncbi:carbon-nitrogen hydrolase family protein [soil metagenome]